MTFGCRNATRQPKASPLSAKERVVVSLSEWYWMSIAWAQVLSWLSCKTLFQASLQHSSECENWLEVFFEVCWSSVISGLQVILKQTTCDLKRLIADCRRPQWVNREIGSEKPYSPEDAAACSRVRRNVVNWLILPVAYAFLLEIKPCKSKYKLYTAKLRTAH